MNDSPLRVEDLHGLVERKREFVILDRTPNLEVKWIGHENVLVVGEKVPCVRPQEGGDVDAVR